ncbi:TonB-dependent receptor domain-containing protein [Algimonas porphyrae]|nr:TonB-dependent receptor [Algimonas porphyrae]
MRRTLKSKFLLSTIMGGVMASAGMTAAMAQDATADEDEVIVTGSRLNVNPNLTAANPVLTVDDSEISFRGTVNIEDLTNNLPQVFAGQAAEVSNGSSGTSTLNLRGLGAVRTLTLIDGRRLPYGSSQTTAVNLDLIPTNLVERVEILTGGASAVYGSDAIGGVANFILKRDFEGVELDAQYSFEQNSNGIDLYDDVLRAGGQPVPDSVTDGEQINLAATIGVNSADGRGNVTIHGSYQNREEIVQANRSFSACTLGASTGASSANGFGCVGSGNFRLFAGPGGLAFQQEDGTIIPYVGGPAQTFNFGASNFFQRPAERVTIFGKGHYEIFDGHELFADISYVNNFSDAQIAPSASFGFGAYQINCDNPLINGTPGLNLATDVYGCTAADIAAGNDVGGITASHRNVEGGSRNSRLENEALRMSFGLRGTLADSWDYELFTQFSRTNDESISTNDFVIANLQDAFFAVDDGNGNVVCRSGNPGCVPYNVFTRPGGQTGVTQAALDYIQGIGIVSGETEQLVFGGNAQTNLSDYGIASPWAPDTGVGLLVGAEWREDTLNATPDQISQIPGGGFTGVGGATLPVQGSVQVFELFGELEVPIVTGMAGIHELVFNGQYRYSDYDTDGNGVQNSFSTDAYGLQLRYAPVEELTFRGQFQRAVRAPGVIELFTGQNTNLPNLNQLPNGLFDPCAGPTPAASAAACANTGVTAAQYGSVPDVIAGQTQSLTGGNPLLNPEVSDTYTLGLVFTPTFVDGLNITVDYFDITVEDFINAGIPSQTVLDNCLATGDATFCSLITRDALGSLNSGQAGVGFQSTNINIAELSTSGFDVQVGYQFDLAGMGAENAGDFALQYAGTFTEEFNFVPFPGDAGTDCAGFFGNACDVANTPVVPSYRHRAIFTWNTPVDGLQVNTTWRHYSGVDNIGANPAPVDTDLPAQDYVDLAASYEFMEGITGRVGVNNLFLEQPPVSISAGPPLGNGNTFPTIYDTGRFIFFGLNTKF